ncbi:MULTISPECIES: intein-containing Rv2578c family radical SAM protein [unclassified Leifsonia]|uniref:intein-containing Rv2578c family radical SAM protein n=1 Tax=unclassified Leifsonia TaxID=2663824 RepID=UPI0006F5AFEF|nr:MULTISPECIES: intein-containing Rv2578c family radical SAM protein [unclassified Leifsonia]KQX05651.1 radical SAM protein [Leifsonia sp. Root1293]KRA09287.1 radical SAM protein [Leifsonia sp. Root60]
MRWSNQELGVENADALPGLAKLNNLVRSVRTPEFAGMTFHEVLAKSALNKLPVQSQVPMEWTINPYRGCSHACAYCLHPDTLVLMADGRQRPLRDVAVGDAIIGTETRGRYRRYVETRVSAKWATRKPACRVVLADGTEIIASGDHRFLTERGWKHVTGSMTGPTQRPYLTANNKLMGFGKGVAVAATDIEAADYRHGYLTGMIRGDGMMLRREYARRVGHPYVASRFRLALADIEALTRTRRFMASEGVPTFLREFSPATDTRRRMNAIFTSKSAHYDRIGDLIRWQAAPSAEWQAGYLGGIFDAEGSCSRGILRISNSDERILREVESACSTHGLTTVREGPNAIGVSNIRVTGGLPARDRFFRIAQPAITRKLALVGAAVKSDAKLEVISIEPLDEIIDMLDITTGTGDFVANGVISHNCFARPTHTYLDLDGGDDFDRQIIVKVNVAEVLRKELNRPSWKRDAVALGTNTDPYQRAEGRYALMPGIIGALADTGTPFSILTKGTLLRRDLPLLADAATRVPVDIAMSIAVYDDELQQSVEPGTPTTKARLATVTAVRDAGLDCSVFMMPILPFLTDTIAHLDEAMRQAKEAGATGVVHSALHLKPGVKEWYFLWLGREHPELLPKYRAMYRGTYAPKEYRTWLAERVAPLVRKHGLNRTRLSPNTGGVLSRSDPEPTLF